MKNIGIIGCGYWGAKHARVAAELPGVTLHSVSDFETERYKAITDKYPGVYGTNDYRQLINNPEIDGIIIAAPASTHYKLALEVLSAGKNALVEKPLTIYPQEAQHLIDVANQNHLTLMVGHTFEYNPAVEALRDVIMSGMLGELYYLDTARLNLGLYQRDVNVIHDLCPHDISIMIYVLGQRPVEVATRGYSVVHGGVVDVAYIEYRFENGLVANSRLSWLSPKKVREMTIVGGQKMVVYDDAAEDGKIQVFDKGVVPPQETEKFSDWKFAYQYGEIYNVPIGEGEPLKREVTDFIECMETGRAPRTDGVNGRSVVSVLNAAQQSLLNNGRPQPVEYYDAVPVSGFRQPRKIKPLEVGATARRAFNNYSQSRV